MDRSVFQILRYANCWEDPIPLLDNFTGAKNGNILSIASGGDNSFSLLTLSPSRLVAFDLNPAQLSTVRLKIAAMKHLSYVDALGFLGFRSMSTKNRRRLYIDAVAPRLSLSDRSWFQKNQKKLLKGIIHGGKFESYFQIFRGTLLSFLFTKKERKEFIEITDKEERKEFLETHRFSRNLKKIFRLFFNKTLMGFLGRDPSFFDHVEGGISARVQKNAERGLINCLGEDNPFLSYIFFGRFRTLPHFLRQENYQSVLDNLDSLELFHGTYHEYHQNNSSVLFHAHNLSDIFEYMDEETSRNEFRFLSEISMPKATLAYWNMMVDRYADLTENHWKMDTAASEKGLEGNRAFFYSRFLVYRRYP